MNKRDAIVLVVADEKKFAEEREYAKGLVMKMEEHGLLDHMDILVYKTLPANAAETPLAIARGGDPYALPVDNATYANVPVFWMNSIDELKGRESIKIIGAGYSTLNAVLQMESMINNLSGDEVVETSYVTHMVDDQRHLKKIADNDVRLFIPEPVSREMLMKIDPVAGARVDLVALESVPSMNSENVLEGLRGDYEKSGSSSRGHDIQEMAKTGRPFAVAIVNAGFSVLNKRYPYTREEADRNGKAYAQSLLASGVSDIVLVEGGSRNAGDRDQIHKERLPSATGVVSSFSEASKPMDSYDPFSVFREAITTEMYAHGVEPRFYEERYADKGEYNAVNATLYLAATSPNCSHLLTNSEEWGTMATAVQCIDNSRVVLGMFDFAANHEDKTGRRNDNTNLYHQRGVALFSANTEGNLEIRVHPEQKKTPYKIENGANTILSAMKLTESLRSIRVHRSGSAPSSPKP